ncbi:hypothetical protein SPFL3102_01717 [Sporomusaceae bacterium FL31]|nr:hypothetical protein SPFL3101_03351 [Sporomusaceae bacterium FL31]GCE33908.1 hypothetical protein SPFL3102_01717 [Sporomusaceae bacterium]
MIKFNQLWKSSEFGLVIDWNFHTNNRWVSALTPYLVNALVEEFRPIIISSQLEYELHKRKIKYIVSMEPGWAAPKIVYDKKQRHVVGVFVSDPHNKTDWFQSYVEKNDISFAFSLYNKPFWRHFPNFMKSKFVHMPWAIPDQYISHHEISVRNSEVVIFGAKNSDAYDIRNWCREQAGVVNYDLSGVENKQLSDEEYFHWLTTFDAIIAAGSSNPIYDLVTPKYFEIAASGALLVGQFCEDLTILGFDDSNSVSFNQDSFLCGINNYKDQPQNYLSIRNNARSLIKSKHKISDRVKFIRNLFCS